MEPLSLVIHSASGRADRGDYFCPQSGAIDDHAPSPGPVHRWTECIPASAGPLFPDAQSGRDGQFSPMDLGRLIAGRGGPNGAPCALSEVRIYSGEPDARRDPRTYAAHRRQTRRWASDGATVITRALRYPPGWPAAPAQEKGVDVALAVDFVKLAIEGEYDVGVMMSTDNDLLPALEVVRDYAPDGIHVAVSVWSVPGQHQRLRLPGLWCHWLDQADYNAVADRTRY